MRPLSLTVYYDKPIDGLTTFTKPQSAIHFGTDMVAHAMLPDMLFTHTDKSGTSSAERSHDFLITAAESGPTHLTLVKTLVKPMPIEPILFSIEQDYPIRMINASRNF